ncbi:hypothetical protein ACLOJK_028768 [Asimina triloba]
MIFPQTAPNDEVKIDQRSCEGISQSSCCGRKKDQGEDNLAWFSHSLFLRPFFSFRKPFDDDFESCVAVDAVQVAMLMEGVVLHVDLKQVSWREIHIFCQKQYCVGGGCASRLG